MPHASPPQTSRSSSSYFTYPVTHTVSGLLRRLTDPNATRPSNQNSNSNMGSVYRPPVRKASPFQPPPLAPLTLTGYKESTRAASRLLTTSLAEEIRLLVPPRLQLVDQWDLAYSLEQNGASIHTLFEKSDMLRGKRGGFVIVVQDGAGGVSVSPFHIRNSQFQSAPISLKPRVLALS